MDALNISIVTPEGKIFEGPATSIVAPGVQGSFGVLRDHAPIISALEPGIVKIEHEKGTDFYVLNKGFVEVRSNSISVLADRVEPATDYTDAQAKLAAHSIGAA